MSERSADRRVSAARQPFSVAVARRVGLAAARRIRTGYLAVELPDGSRHVFGDRASARRAEIRVHDMAALQRILVNGETGATIVPLSIQGQLLSGVLLASLPSNPPLQLVANTDPTTEPVGTSYLVTEQLASGNLAPWHPLSPGWTSAQ